MSKYFSICIFLCGLPFAKAQNADSLFAAGDFALARVAFERNVFEGQLVTESLLKKSWCFKAESRFDEAYQTLQRINYGDEKVETQASVLYEMALNGHLSGKNDIATGHLAELHYIQNDSVSLNALIVEILALNELGRWNEAKLVYEKYLARTNSYESSDVYNDIVHKKRKSPKLAQGLSMIVPGSGQIYAGYPLRGLFSTSVNGGLVAYAVYSFTNAYYLSGAFTGVGLVFLFYNGGALYATKLAEKKNAQRAASFNQKIRERLLEE